MLTALLEQSSQRAKPFRTTSAAAWSRGVPGVETRWRLPSESGVGPFGWLARLAPWRNVQDPEWVAAGSAIS
jgi:hypothetical protein